MWRSLALLALFTASAAMSVKVSGLIATVRIALQHKQSDKRLAGELHKLSLDEQLDWRTIEELESEGAGPKTVSALEMLLEESQGLPSPAQPPFQSPPAPTAEEKNQVLEEAARNSLNYAASLPDFICTETVRRFEDAKLKEKQNWELKDTLTLKLGYFSHVEDYKLVAINGKPTYRTYEEVGGAVSQGEFGSLLISIFRGAPRDRFAWDHWTTLRRRPTMVYAFRVKLEHATYNIHFEAAGYQPVTVLTGQHGFVYIDHVTKQVVRVYMEADDIPDDFPVTSVTTMLDYDFVDVGGRQFLLPLSALVRMGTHRMQMRNEVAFEQYRKFTSDTSITFDLKDGK